MARRRIIHNIKEMQQFANQIAASLQSGDVIGLVGELGAGKTTFVQYLAKALGVKERIVSPTFLIMRIYTAHSPRAPYVSQFVHLDAYRIEDQKELESIGAFEYIGVPTTITVIEWADRVKNVLPRRTRWFRFEHGRAPQERVVRFSTPPRGRLLPRS